MIDARWYLLGAVLAILAGVGVYACHNRVEVAAHTEQANQQHGQAVTNEAQAVKDDLSIAASKPLLEAKDKEVARLKAEVARLRALAVGNPVSIAQPSVDSLVGAQDGLIAAMDSEIGALKEQNKELELRGDHWKATAEAYKAESRSLRQVISHTPKDRPWAVGLIYGTDKTVGAWVEKDLGPIRLGADIVRRSLGDRSTLEATARIGWRF